MTLTLTSIVQLTTPQAETLRQVHARPGWQRQSHRPRCRELAAIGLLEAQDGTRWFVTRPGLDWLEANR